MILNRVSIECLSRFVLSPTFLTALPQGDSLLPPQPTRTRSQITLAPLAKKNNLAKSHLPWVLEGWFRRAGFSAISGGQALKLLMHLIRCLRMTISNSFRGSVSLEQVSQELRSPRSGFHPSVFLRLQFFSTSTASRRILTCRTWRRTQRTSFGVRTLTCTAHASTRPSPFDLAGGLRLAPYAAEPSVRTISRSWARANGVSMNDEVVVYDNATMGGLFGSPRAWWTFRSVRGGWHRCPTHAWARFR